METFKSLLDAFNNIDPYLKAILGVIGVFAAFSKLRESFALRRRKEELKLDLEILKELKANHIPSSEIEKKINFELEKAFEDRDQSVTNFFAGIGVFIGFGLWSISIFQNSEGFNGWMVLTLVLSLMGLAIMLGGNEKSSEKKELFYQIGFYGKSDFQFNIILVLLTGILTPVIHLKSGGFSYWEFLTGFFFLIGLAGLFRCVKRIRN